MKKALILFAAVAVMATAAVPAMAALDFPSVAGLEPGALIKSTDSSAVYYFGEDEQRYAFPNENTYYTWYNDFDSVETISVSEMGMIPFGGSVTYMPQFGNDGASTRLLKLTTGSTVYVSIGDGMLVAIKNEDQANSLFGDRWMDLVDMLPDAFVPSYTVLGGHMSDGVAFVEPYDYSISDDKELNAATGIMMYEQPLRFAAEDETVELSDTGDHCGSEFCGYNVVTVDQGDTLKFVNYTTEALTIRESDNLFTTGAMESEDVAVLTIDLDPGEYYFGADEDDDMLGVLIVE